VVYRWQSMELQAQETLRRCSLPPNCQIVVSSPIAHAYALNAVFTCFLGGLPLGLPEPSPSSVFEFLRRQADRPAVLMASPAFYEKFSLLGKERLVKEFATEDLPCPLPSRPLPILSAYSAGCGLPEETWEMFKAYFGVPIMQNYGTSETGNISLHERPYASFMKDYVGIPWGEIKFRGVRESGEGKDKGAYRGEILVKVPWMSLGYISGSTLVDHGSFHPTGDLGTLREEEPRGLCVGPRIRRRLVVSDEAGAQRELFPHEVEGALRSLPFVKEAVAVQGPGEIGAFVLCKHEGRGEGGRERTRDIEDWWRRRFPGFPPLRRVKLVESLPTSQAGKVVFKNLTWQALLDPSLSKM